MADLVVNSRVTIPDAELAVSFSRAGGPGGQHVNKTESRVELRWNVVESGALHASDRKLLMSRLRSRLTAAGELVVAAGSHRSQHRNREDARARLAELVRGALVPVKRRIRTRPSRGAVERRLDSKRKRAGRKRDRKWRPD